MDRNWFAQTKFLGKLACILILTCWEIDLLVRIGKRISRWNMNSDWVQVTKKPKTSHDCCHALHQKITTTLDSKQQHMPLVVDDSKTLQINSSYQEFDQAEVPRAPKRVLHVWKVTWENTKIKTKGDLVHKTWFLCKYASLNRVVTIMRTC